MIWGGRGVGGEMKEWDRLGGISPLEISFFHGSWSYDMMQSRNDQFIHSS